MMSEPETNYSIRDLAAACPRLRDDLEIHFQDGGYILEDPLKGSYFTIGAVEYRFLQLLDGTRAVAEVVGQLSIEAQSDAMPEEAAYSLIRSLADADLLEGYGNEKAERVRTDIHRKQDSRKLLQKSKGILFLRLPLGNPDRLLDTILPWFGWLVSPWCFVIWIGVVVSGLISVFRNWQRFGEEMSGMFDVGNLFFLGIIWIILKIFHEGCHALFCKKFGGSVPEVGVVLLLFVTPLGYVNASSATKFQSKWKRIFVSAAGIYGELFIAGLAAILWSRLDPGAVSRGLHEVIVISSVTTIFFNANPLMRFDGYYIFSDLTGVANLYSKAQRRASFFFRCLLLGADRKTNPETGEPRWITVYGVAAYIWKFFVVFGILVFVSQSWNGAGLVICSFVLLSMIISGLVSCHKYFKSRARQEGVRISQALLSWGMALLLISAVLAFVKVTPGIRVPAVVEWQGEGDVRVDCPGFIERVHVSNGDEVSAGDLLISIKNPDEEARIQNLRYELKRRLIQSDKYRTSGNISAHQAEEIQISALKLRLRGEEEYIDSLHLRANRDGLVFGEQLFNLEGTFVSKGQLLCSVGKDDEKQLTIAIAEDRSDSLLETVGAKAWFRARGRIDSVPSIISRINTQASTRLPHFALAAPAGGPIVTRRILGTDSEELGAESRINSHSLTNQYELSKPYFKAVANLGEVESRKLEVGEVGFAKIYRKEALTIGQVLWRKYGLLFERQAGRS